MNPIDVARKIIGILLDLVPHTVAQQLLTDEAIRRANTTADMAEAIKFGGGQ